MASLGWKGLNLAVANNVVVVSELRRMLGASL
jgi:hypothetical protein